MNLKPQARLQVIAVFRSHERAVSATGSKKPHSIALPRARRQSGQSWIPFSGLVGHVDAGLLGGGDELVRLLA